MLLRGRSGDLFAGIAVALLIAVPAVLCQASQPDRLDLEIPAGKLELHDGSFWFPIPPCDDAQLDLTFNGKIASAHLGEVAYIRDQRIGLFHIEEQPERTHGVSVQAHFKAPRGKLLVDTGPLARILNKSLVGYSVAPTSLEAGATGTVVRAENLAGCISAYPDILLICGHAIYASQYVDSLASLWAVRMGLNVAAIDVANISTSSPVMIRDFIKSLYDTRCAANFGDGHLGFVVLLGDAYEDDNTTRMVPDYDGYGGTSEASDHYYACVSGTDDFEDVMLGRIPVGNVSELAIYYGKARSYSPLPTEDWTKSLLLIAGCFFTYNEDYIDLFDQYQSYVPGDFSVSRFYRYDYPLTSTGDVQACQAVTDSLNKGFLMALYSGDGDKWDWGAVTERAFKSSYIPNLTNTARLPIVLSIACSNGWFDNRTYFYADGGVDCFAERLLVAPAGGAIACVASPRETGGGATTVFAHEILKSAFVNGSSLLGEMLLEAKTRHLLNLGSVAYVRQFTLFGDPCINFVLNQLPVDAPDLVVRPYHVRVEPDFATLGAPVTVEAEVWNASGVFIDLTDVGLYQGLPDSGGTLLDTRELADIYPWEKRTVSFTIGNPPQGDLTLSVMADVSGELAEADEANNLVATTTYVYPCEIGFPIKVNDVIRGHVAADLDGDGENEILVTSGGSTAQAIDLDGTSIWVRKDLGLTQWFDGVEPAAADLNGDGTTECVLPFKTGIMVVEGATGNTRWKVNTDYPCLSPAITDLDGDDSFEILLGTYSFTYSRIWAYDASGTRRWIYDVPGAGAKLTGMVVCDTNLDGAKEVIYSTTSGKLTCLECSTTPPTVAWQTVLSAGAISSIVGGDLERDGSIEIVANHDTTMSIIRAADGFVEDRITIGPQQCMWNLSLADADRDGQLEILCGSSCGEIAMVDDRVMTLHVFLDGTPFRAPVVADIDGDGAHELIFSLSEGWLRIINLDGSDQIPPLPMRGSCAVTPIADNIDSDPDVEVIVGSTDSVLFVMDLAQGGGVIEWSYAGCSPYRTSLYAQPLFGTLSQDLVLSGRVNVVGDVLVGTGLTLTLERYTDMLFMDDSVSPLGPTPGRCEIMVDGHMVSRGTQAGKVRLRPAGYPPGKDSWQGILLRPGSTGSFTQTEVEGAITAIESQTSEACISECKISNSSIGVKVTNAEPLIDSNTFSSDDYGISVNGGDPLIVNNVISSCLYSGMVISTSSNATVEANRVTGTVQGNGLAVYSSSPKVRRGNRFEDNSESGIYLNASSPMIDSCWIGGSGDCGIKAAYYSNPVISGTSIVGNKIGLGAYINSKPVLGDTAAGLGGLNDIRQNTTYAVYNRTPYPVKAQNNWWGTDDPGPGLFYGVTDYSGWLVIPPSGVGDEPGISALLQAVCPNPFSGSMEIRMAVSREDLPVSVGIYDVSGRLVRWITSREATGDVRIRWDGLDAFGNRAASGTYFVAVTSARSAQTRKIILLK
jgi:parallel beta-helix repeat protein